MNYGTGHQSRQFLAAALVLQLCLVSLAPLWHHSPHQSVSSVPRTHTEGPDIHICLTGDHRSGALGPCPVCTSQRLLTQGITEHSVHVSAPSEGTNVASSSISMVTFALSLTSQPRAPPIV
jgi:hypothetical protein